jgi:hypothetical protein
MMDGTIEAKETYLNGLWIFNLWLQWEHLEEEELRYLKEYNQSSQ